jgi:CDP-2,3-bis-(O-geranylgeranyl)-sn-glycerol synthase
MINIILQAIWFILPAYFANSTPVVASKFLSKYNKPIDFRKTLKGKPILGPGKTWMGLAAGLIIASFVGYIQGITLIHPLITWKIGFLLGCGALLGDIIASFIKRRVNLKRGSRVFGLDQLDFILGAFFFAWLINQFNITYFIIILIITPAIHLLANFLAYKIGVKQEPW